MVCLRVHKSATGDRFGKRFGQVDAEGDAMWVSSKRRLATSSPGVTWHTKLGTSSWSSTRSLSSSATSCARKLTNAAPPDMARETAASLTVPTAALLPCSPRPTLWCWSLPPQRNVPKQIFLFALATSTQPRSLVRDGQSSPHKPRLVVPHSTCPSLSPSPPAHSFS